MKARFGTPNYDKRSNFKRTRNLKENETVRVRIMPPMGTMADKGVWFAYYSQHYGYITPDAADGDKKNYWTFQCVEKVKWVNKHKTIAQHCPECDVIEEKKAQKDSTAKAFEEKGKKAGLAADDLADYVTKALTPFETWLRAHNVDRKCYINVKFDDGTFGTMKIAHKAKDALLNDQGTGLIQKLLKRAKPIDAIRADQGVWFDISKTGKGFKTTWEVNLVTDTVEVDGESFERPKLAPLSEQDAETAEAACFDLADVGIRVLSVDKIKRLTELSDDDVDAIEAIFKTPVQAAGAPVPSPEIEVAQEPQVVTKQQEAAPAAPEAPVVAKPAPVAKVVTKAPAAPLPDPTEMSEEEFLRTYKLK